MKQKHIEMLKNTAAQFALLLLPLRKKLIQWTTHDHQWIIIILFYALLLRLPSLTHPDTAYFDEQFYANITLHSLDSRPFFFIHPPLAPILFSQIIEGTGPLTAHPITIIDQHFGDFPFGQLRLFVAILGSLLPLLIYAIGRTLKYPPRSAAIPALFIVIDSAFIIYSRAILPDTPLLFLNFLAFGCALLMLRTKNTKLAALLLATAGIAIGCALSIKWLALGVLATIWCLFLSERRYSAIITSGLIACATYIAIFTAFFFYFPNGGHPDPMLPAFDIPLIQEIEFPKTDNLMNIVKFLPEQHRTMLDANNNKEIGKYILDGSGSITWPTARSSIVFWRSEDGKTIILQGNSLLWMISFLLLCFQIGWICWHMKHERKWPLERDETILLAGYVLNYLPFFFIHRPMYLYHYLTAIIFLFLMIPKIAPRMIDCIAVLSRDRLFAMTLASFTLFLIVLYFIFLMPTIYGF
jgi:dolichyl-phosphate-mannose--protein O-mannosyl transferase